MIKLDLFVRKKPQCLNIKCRNRKERRETACRAHEENSLRPLRQIHFIIIHINHNYLCHQHSIKKTQKSFLRR